MMSLGQGSMTCGSDYTVPQTRKTSKNHAFFMKNQAKSLIFHGFPCQNLLSAADMLTAGAGGATGASQQLHATK